MARTSVDRDTVPFIDSEEPTKRVVRDTEPEGGVSAVLPCGQVADPGPAAVPFDVIPVLAVPRGELPWEELSELAKALVVHIDGYTRTVAILRRSSAGAIEGIHELADLVRRGLVRLESPADRAAALDLDLSNM
jgi:hypothetical protein